MSEGNTGIQGGLQERMKDHSLQSYNFYGGNKLKALGLVLSQTALFSCINQENEVHGILFVDDEH